MDRIDWVEVVSERLYQAVLAYMSYNKIENVNDFVSEVDNALECVLSNSCAGPASISRAMEKLADYAESKGY